MKRSVLPVRGMSVGVLYCEAQDASVLAAQFRRLGMPGRFFSSMPSGDALAAFDIVMFDSDHAAVLHHAQAVPWPDRPRIAILGSETPSRLEWVLAQDVTSYLRKPVRHEGVLSACMLAVAQHRILCDARAKIDRLNSRIKARRYVLTALLALMNEQNIDESRAYAALRTLAMQRNMCVEDLCIALATAP